MMNQLAAGEPRPWNLPIWKPDQTKRAILFYLVVTHVLAVVGLILFPIPSVRVSAAALIVTCLGGFGTTVCYHRLLAHRTFRLNKVVEHVLISWAVLNGSGAPATWVAYHRHHHSHADTPNDISSPRYGGFWWAHLRWLYQSPPADVQRWCPELQGGGYRFWEYAESPMILVSLFWGAALGPEGFFWIGPIRLVYSLHMQCLVNSLTHLSDDHERDASRNIWWLGPLQLTAWGENWHRNHHAFPGSARLGLRWWQIDIGWYFICGLKTVGLATHVKRPQGRRR
jgi:stearoyl-CoA desaturase (delta-9 desaturase)